MLRVLLAVLVVALLLGPISDELPGEERDFFNGELPIAYTDELAIPYTDSEDLPAFAPPLSFTEVVANRTRHSKLFVSDVFPELFRLDVSTSALHFGSPGSFLDIDSSIVVSSANVPTLGTADLEMTQDDFEWFALQTLNQIPLLLFRSKDAPDSFVNLNPDALQWRNDLEDVSIVAQPSIGVLGQVTDETLLWVDGYGSGRNLSISLGANQMKKELRLEAAPPAPPQFILDGGNPVLELLFFFGLPNGPSSPDVRIDGVLWDQAATRDTGQEVIFEIGGVPLFVFRSPFASDSSGNETAGILQLSKTGATLKVGVRIPIGFLENATYPVLIDPTVNLQIGAGSDDCDTEQNNPGLDCGGTAHDVPGNDAGEGDVGNASFRFTSVTVPQGSIILDSTFSPFTSTDGDDGAGTRSRIFLEADDNATVPVSEADFDSRNRTTNFTAWDDQNFVSGFADSPDIAPQVGEVINRTGWQSGNSLQVFWQYVFGAGAGHNYEFRSFEDDPSRGAKLQINFTAGPPPIVETLPADPVLGMSARLQGNLTDIMGAPSVEAGFEWGDTIALGNVTPTQTLTANGTFSFDLTGLATSTMHFFQAVADFSNGTTLNFTTQAAFVPPAVVTEIVVVTGPSFGILEGSVTTLGELNITEANVSFEWGFSPSTLDFNTTPELVAIPGSFQATVSDLDPGTTVFYRAVLEFNPFVFGEIESFATLFEGFVAQPATIAAIILSLLAILLCLYAARRQRDTTSRGIAALCGIVIIFAGFVWLIALLDFGIPFAALIALVIVAVGLIIFFAAAVGRRN